MATAVERYQSRLNWEMICKVDGSLYPSSEARFKEIRDMEIKPDDIALVTYPKSGTNWVQQILCYLRDDAPLDQIVKYRFAPLELVNPGMPGTPLQLIEQMPAPRIVVSHFPFGLTPLGIQQGKCKIIYVTRNPKDVAVSFFHFQRKIGHFVNLDEFPWSDFFEVFCEPGKMMGGSWFGHVKNWLQHRDKDNVFFITYEELKNDSTTGIQRMASFLGKNISLERAKGIAHLCDFKQMRANAEEREMSDDGKSTIKPTNFIRKGEVGDWKNYFTVAQSETFDDFFKKEMENIDMNIEFDV